MWTVLLHFVLTLVLLGKQMKHRGFLSIKTFEKEFLFYLFLYYMYLFLFHLNLSFEIPILVLLGILPFLGRTVYKIYIQREIEKGMINFLQLLNSRLVIDEDLISSIENITEYVTSGAIRRILREFVVIFKVSCNPALAFDTMQKVNHAYLRYVFLNIRAVMESWGNPGQLIQELENEYISVYTELNKGRAELQNDKLMTYLGLLLAGITAYNVLANHALMVRYYASRPLLLIVLALLASIGIFVLAASKIGE